MNNDFWYIFSMVLIVAAALGLGAQRSGVGLLLDAVAGAICAGVALPDVLEQVGVGAGALGAVGAGAARARVRPRTRSRSRTRRGGVIATATVDGDSSAAAGFAVSKGSAAASRLMRSVSMCRRICCRT